MSIAGPFDHSPGPEDEPLVTPGEPDLAERELRILAFERQWWQFEGKKEQAIRDEFDISSTRYYQILHGLIERPEALAHDPMLVKRLRRLRASRRKQRTARRLGIRL